MRRKLFPKHAEPPANDAPAELDEILCDLQSPEESVRADAVRRLCPCRGVDWGEPVFQKVIAMRNDPSPVVRHAVDHDLGENPQWGKRWEERRLHGRRIKKELHQVKKELQNDLVDVEGTVESEPPSYSLGWRTRPRRRSHPKHRLM